MLKLFCHFYGGDKPLSKLPPPPPSNSPSPPLNNNQVEKLTSPPTSHSQNTDSDLGNSKRHRSENKQRSQAAQQHKQRLQTQQKQRERENEERENSTTYDVPTTLTLSYRFPMFTPRDLANEFVAFLGEFIGTFLFLFFAFAATQTVNHAASLKSDQDAPGNAVAALMPMSKNTDTNTLVLNMVSNVPNVDNLLFISVVFGLSLMVNVWVFYRVSGGMFNPAVTMALYMVGAFGLLRAIVVIYAQIIGGITAAAVVKYLIPNGRNVNFTVALSAGTSIFRGLILEMIFTAELVFTILMLAAEKSKSTFLAPIGIGFALFIGHICIVFFTGSGLNPARSFGPAVVAGKFPPYHWIYWLGPILGGLVAVSIYRIFKLLRYEDTNGDADKAEYEPEMMNDEKFKKLEEKKLEPEMDMYPRAMTGMYDRTMRRDRTGYSGMGESPPRPLFYGGERPLIRRQPGNIKGPYPPFRPEYYNSNIPQEKPSISPIPPLPTQTQTSQKEKIISSGSSDYNSRPVSPASTVRGNDTAEPTDFLPDDQAYEVPIGLRATPSLQIQPKSPLRYHPLPHYHAQTQGQGQSSGSVQPQTQTSPQPHALTQDIGAGAGAGTSSSQVPPRPRSPSLGLGSNPANYPLQAQIQPLRGVAGSSIQSGVGGGGGGAGAGAGRSGGGGGSRTGFYRTGSRDRERVVLRDMNRPGRNGNGRDRDRDRDGLLFLDEFGNGNANDTKGLLI